MKDRKKSKTGMPTDETTSSLTTTASREVQQAGAICYRRKGEGGLEVLLVGSRRNGRWGVPKGHLDPNKTTYLAAVRESFEEAGVVGKVDQNVFGMFSYTKDSSPHRYQVAVHLLEVSDQSAEFPEKAVRKQKWFSLENAIREAAQPGLRALLVKLETSPL